MSETQVAEQTAHDDTNAEAEAVVDQVKETPETTTAEDSPETLLTQSDEGEGEKPEEGEKEPEEGAGAEKKAEATYEDFDLPDGYEPHPDDIKAFHDLAKSSGLDQAQAQAFINQHVAMLQRSDASHLAFLDEVRGQWEEQAKVDPEIGGAAFEQNLDAARRVLRKINIDGLGKLLDDSRLGSHPDMIRAFYRLDKMLGEDTLVEGSPPSTEPKPAALRVYPDQGKDK